MATRRWAKGTAICAGLAVLTLVVALIWPSPKKSDASDSSDDTTTTDAPASEGACPDSWAVQQADNGDNRWFREGIASIRAATDPVTARAAAYEWLDRVKADPELLEATIFVFLEEDVEADDLVDDGCMSAAAVTQATQLEAYFAASIIEPAQAPANGTNTGVNSDGQVTVASTAGVTGDTASVRVTGPDGKEADIMARCGNLVLLIPPSGLPEGPTDNPTQGCPPPEGVLPEHWDPVNCVKLDTSEDWQQNHSDVAQAVQDQSTSGVDTGPTPGAPATPHVPAPGPTPQEGTPAPSPTPGGYDSGSPDGSATDPDGTTTGGGPDPATDNPEDSGQGGNNTAPIPEPVW